MTVVEHVDFLVEEPSMGAFLRVLLPRLLGSTPFDIIEFGGKTDLFRKLPDRMKGYAAWIPENYRIVVLVDQDDEDCLKLKATLEGHAHSNHLVTRSSRRSAEYTVANRIAVEELEAWYFGDWEAVSTVFPGVDPSLPRRKGFRDPDAIKGGTWEAFERILQRAGHFTGGLPKRTVAGQLGQAIEPARNRSRSFQVFAEALADMRA